MVTIYALNRNMKKISEFLFENFHFFFFFFFFFEVKFPVYLNRLVFVMKYFTMSGSLKPHLASSKCHLMIKYPKIVILYLRFRSNE